MPGYPENPDSLIKVSDYESVIPFPELRYPCPLNMFIACNNFPESKHSVYQRPYRS